MKILIVDDEEMQRDMLQGFLEKQGHVVLSAGSGEDALAIFDSAAIDLALLDQKMGGMSGDELLFLMKKKNPLVRAIMITAYASVDTAVKVMRLGADDFLEKPVDLRLLLDKIEAIAAQLAVEEDAGEIAAFLEEQELPFQVIGESPAMKELLSLVRRMARTPWTVLIRGETGTGKELVGRLLHSLSPRQAKPFIELNCAAVPENLFESELFGHEKGAFTGADARRKGRFELAQGGTLFLDEVGELPLNLQAKLLRALQESRISRVGSEQDIEVDVRVVAATNRDLKMMVEKGEFREDLFYRLNVLELEVPPLRRRKEDIPALVDFFLGKYAAKSTTMSREALDALVKYPFPGNIRELEHLIQRVVALARSSKIMAADLPREIRLSQVANGEGDLGARLNEVEREMIVEALKQHDWVQTRAADALGISERVLRYKMGKHQIKKG
ncbi:MAG: sigma-54 dependent transcriptional regulator [Proteobacteria bacterium]|nr:sigma-54 dependent transcriptional regulator [Pseudomonadota bacterium]MBU1639702.1 sigma-54 dependent transcriptional regulator [Pseudomonadota bacterium]